MFSSLLLGSVEGFRSGSARSKRAADPVELSESIGGGVPSLTFTAGDQVEGDACPVGVLIERQEFQGALDGLCSSFRSKSRVLESRQPNRDIDRPARRLIVPGVGDLPRLSRQGQGSLGDGLRVGSQSVEVGLSFKLRNSRGEVFGGLWWGVGGDDGSLG